MRRPASCLELHCVHIYLLSPSNFSSCNYNSNNSLDKNLGMQNYFTKLFYKIILQNYFTKLFYKIILQNYFTKLFYKIILQNYFTKLFYKIILQNYFTKLFYKIILQNYFTKLFYKIIQGSFFGNVPINICPLTFSALSHFLTITWVCRIILQNYSKEGFLVAF